MHRQICRGANIGQTLNAQSCFFPKNISKAWVEKLTKNVLASILNRWENHSKYSCRILKNSVFKKERRKGEKGEERRGGGGRERGKRWREREGRKAYVGTISDFSSRICCYILTPMKPNNNYLSGLLWILNVIRRISWL